MKAWTRLLWLGAVVAVLAISTGASVGEAQDDTCRTTFLLRFAVQQHTKFPNYPLDLFWAVHGATQVELKAQGMEWETVPAVALREIRHEDDTSYTLRITNSEGASFESTLHVDIHETPHFYTITATPDRITSGESVTLEWTTRHTHWVTISSLPGANRTWQDTWPVSETQYAADGNLVVSPTETTTYRVMATWDKGDGGTGSHWRFLTVHVD